MCGRIVQQLIPYCYTTVSLGYAGFRVPTNKTRHCRSRALKEVGAERIFEEKSTGGRWTVRNFKRCLIHEGIRPGLADARAKVGLAEKA
jgi:hypothetical protein